MWFGTMSAVRSNQYADRPVSTAPLSGIGVGRTTSYAEIRSDATITIPACVRYMSRTFPCFTLVRPSNNSIPLSQPFEPLEDLVRVHQVPRRIHDRVELRLADTLPHRVDLQQMIAERAALLPGAHPGALHDPVRLLARAARLDQREQHRLRVHEPAARVEVREHPLRVDAHPADHLRRQVHHVVERYRRVGQEHALRRRVRDVALVP